MFHFPSQSHYPAELLTIRIGIGGLRVRGFDKNTISFICGYDKGTETPTTTDYQHTEHSMPSPVSKPRIQEARFEAPLHLGQLFQS
jgi:hypothetical protein